LDATDLKFIHVLQKAASAQKKYPNVYRSIAFGTILRKLIPLFSPKPFDSDLFVFLKELGVLAPWENTFKMGPQITAGLSGYNPIQGDENIDLETQVWGYKLLKEGEFKENKDGKIEKMACQPRDLESLKESSSTEKSSLVYQNFSIKNDQELSVESFSKDECEHLRRDFGDLPGTILLFQFFL
jgi:hypothetical protein